MVEVRAHASATPSCATQCGCVAGQFPQRRVGWTAEVQWSHEPTSSRELDMKRSSPVAYPTGTLWSVRVGRACR